MDMKNDLDFELDNFFKSEPTGSDNFTSKVMLALPPLPKPFYLTAEGFLTLIVLSVGCWKFSFWLPKAFSDFWLKAAIIKSALVTNSSIEIAPSMGAALAVMLFLFLLQKVREAF